MSRLLYPIPQFIVMPDPNDANFTFVRYMNTIKLTDWKAAFQPLASGVRYIKLIYTNEWMPQ